MGHTHRVGWDGGGGAWVREWSGDRQTPLQDHQVQKSLSGHPKHVLLRGLTAAGPGWWRVAAALYVVVVVVWIVAVVSVQAVD
jgi:hypothetical protein